MKWSRQRGIAIGSGAREGSGYGELKGAGPLMSPFDQLAGVEDPALF